MQERLHKVSGQVKSKMVSMATKSSYRLIMGNCCGHDRAIIFNQNFIKLAGNKERYKISDKFDFRADQIIPIGITHP